MLTGTRDGPRRPTADAGETPFFESLYIFIYIIDRIKTLHATTESKLLQRALSDELIFREIGEASNLLLTLPALHPRAKIVLFVTRPRSALFFVAFDDASPPPPP